MSELKVAVVTGAGSGIGRAVSLHLARAGYQVAMAGRRADALEETRTEGGASLASQLHPIVTDVSDEASVKNLFAEVTRRWGRLDVLFNNAGRGGPPVPIEDLPVEIWKDIDRQNGGQVAAQHRCQQSEKNNQTAVPQGKANDMIQHDASSPCLQLMITGMNAAIGVDMKPFGGATRIGFDHSV